MKNIILFMIFSTFSISSAFSGTMSGTYKTEVSQETGGYLLINFAPCEENKLLSCGIIENAIDKKGKVSKKRVEKGEHLVDCEVWSENQNGEITAPARGTVVLPSRTV